jgi:LysM repeat protein
MVGKVVSSASTGSESVAASTSSLAETGYEYYTVRNGDTVWDIAKKFEGVTAADILKLNNLSDGSKIQVGQKLKIRRKS